MDNYCLILIQYLQVHKYIIRYFLVQSKGPKASAAEKLIENILQYNKLVDKAMYVCNDVAFFSYETIINC